MEETRTRYMVQFGKAPANEWYSDKLERALQDYKNTKHLVKAELFEVREVVKDGEVLERIDRNLTSYFD